MWEDMWEDMWEAEDVGVHKLAVAVVLETKIAVDVVLVVVASGSSPERLMP